jgi:hypothetical protein
VADVGRYRIRADHENNGVSLDDQALNVPPSILKGADLGAINQRFETARLERGLQCAAKPMSLRE